MTKTIRATTLTLLILFSWMSLASSAPQHQDWDKLRKQFFAAEKMITQKQWSKLHVAEQALKEYPLYPYLIYSTLKTKLNSHKDSVSFNDIQDFTKEFPDFPFNNFLFNLWLKNEHHQGNWQSIIHALEPMKPFKTDKEKCYYVTSQYQLKQDPEIFEAIKPLWLVSHSQPESCDLLFRISEEKGKISSDLIFKRFELVMKERHYALAEYLLRKLPKKERKIGSEWMRFNHAPQLIFDQKQIKKAHFPKNILPEVLTTSLQKLARADAGRALDWWKANEKKYHFNKDQTQRIMRDLGVFLAHQKHSEALSFLAKVPEPYLDDVAKDWRIRISLYEKKWSSAIKWIERLDIASQQDDQWQYWKARALFHLNKQNEANAIFRKVATSRNYYGFLASNQLGIKPSLNHSQHQLNGSTLKSLESLPAVMRVKELIRCNRPRIARIEWNQLTKDQTETHLLHLAQFAFKQGWYDLSILAMTRTQNQDDLSLRFPLAHRENILHFSQKNKLDPAWIFALARQESAFFSYAKSPVGARGLMQLMPTTATYIAQKSNINYKSHYHLYLPKKNIELGTSYLKFLKNQWQDNPILATASYNAGPSRTKLWLPKTDTPADIWIDNIPFSETRHYVKNVMAFTSIYHEMLGHPPKLKSYMKTIHSKIK